MKRVNELKRIYSTIDCGTSNSKMVNLPLFPKIIEFELTNHCNYQCIMCPTGLGSASRPRGYMSSTTFERIIEELKEINSIVAIKFVGQGEPLLHPNAIEYMKKMKDIGMIVHLTTNGSMLTVELMQELIDIEVDSIKFSFQGVDSYGYRMLRQKDVYDEYISVIKRFVELRGDKEKPYLTIGTSVTNESRERIESFISEYQNVVDKVEVGVTSLAEVDFNYIKDENTKKHLMDLYECQKGNYRRYKCCPQIFDTITIRWNGDITSCCADIEGEMTLGNIKDLSIKDCWNGEKQNLYRKLLSLGEYDKIKLCSNCYDVYGWTYGEN